MGYGMLCLHAHLVVKGPEGKGMCDLINPHAHLVHFCTLSQNILNVFVNNLGCFNALPTNVGL